MQAKRPNRGGPAQATIQENSKGTFPKTRLLRRLISSRREGGTVNAKLAAKLFGGRRAVLRRHLPAARNDQLIAVRDRNGQVVLPVWHWPTGASFRESQMCWQSWRLDNFRRARAVTF